MKQLFLFSLLLLTSINVFAQRAFVAEKQLNPAVSNHLKTTGSSDTLGLAAFRSSEKVLYMDQLGGYAAGTNFFKDRAKAQEFDTTKRLTISKVLFYFGAKKKVAPDSVSYLLVNIYALDTIGIANNNIIKACPGKILHSRKLLIDSIDTIAGNFTVVDFQWAPTDSLTSNFAIGFDMTHLDTADRVGLYSTKDSSANKSQRSWERQSNSIWFTMLKSWPLDIDFAIFPIVDSIVVGIDDYTKEKSIAISTSPNPCDEKVTLTYTLNEPSPVALILCNSLGNTIMQEKIGFQSKGIQKADINTSHLNPGIYFISLQTNKAVLKKKIVVLH